MENSSNHKEEGLNTKADTEIKTGLEKLHTYKQVRLELAAQLRIVREGLNVLGREDCEKQCEELMVKLAEDRFTLAVLGQFKRGKSSLMNAIIGEDILPTGVLPLTSAITILKYGPTERMIVNSSDLIFPKELPVAALPDYVTEKGNPNNEKKVKSIIVELPVPFLRTGIEFVDTPGIGSIFIANTKTTYNFLPECDAVLFVTSVDTPMTSLELDFLKEIREYVSKIFFVVNKIDLVSVNERKEVLAFVTETIQQQTGRTDVKVFPVSSRSGLSSKISNDTVIYEQSGLKALEDALALFLSGEKLATFLAAITQKLVRLIDNEIAQGVFEEAALISRAQTIKEEKPLRHHGDPHESASAINDARIKLEVLYKGILDNRVEEAIEEQPLAEKQNTAESNSTFIQPLPNSLLNPVAKKMDMKADLQTDACPVCRHISEEIFDFFVDWQYQLSTNEKSQNEFAAELGFCPLHMWQLLSISSPRGASIGYAKLFEQLAYRLKTKNKEYKKGDSISQLVHNSLNCRVCEMKRHVEKEYILKLIEMLNLPEGRNQYHNSQGVCIRHLDMLLALASSDDDRNFILSHAAQLFEQDAEDMRSFAMKRDALRRGLLNRNEEDAYLRSLIRFVGDKSVSMPWAGDGEV